MPLEESESITWTDGMNEKGVDYSETGLGRETKSS